VVGDFVISQDGHVYVVTTGGTPGIWIDSAVAGSPVSSVAGRTGAVTLTAADIGAGTFPGALTATNATWITPTIASFVNATHTHADAAGGGGERARDEMVAPGHRKSL